MMKEKRYQPVIGLEIHIELKTRSKMFCDCANDPLERHPNVNVCPICLGHPGVLPVINEEAVNKVIKTGLSLNCQIFEYSKFDRKNYFYPDLPKGYQISQYDRPICLGGKLNGVRIRRVHLEEDTGRLIHPSGADYSLVDFNRAGVPLMELVTEPDLKSAQEARRFAEELQLILRYLGVSAADMENGQMRVEVNVSLKAASSERGGPKVEIKNLNSFKAVEGAVEYEIERQRKEKAVQETRGWDDVRGITLSQRAKEEAKDYRYFPEPDLPPLSFTREKIEEIRSKIPELPGQKRDRLKREYGLGEKEIEILVRNKDLGEYFEKAVSELDPKLPAQELSLAIKLTANYLITDLQGLLKGRGVSGEDFLITPERFAHFISLIQKGRISSKTAKQVLGEMFSAGADPAHIIEKNNLIQISDESELEKIAQEVISQNSRPVEDFKKGKENALQFLVGQVMVKSKGRANPEKVRQILLVKLK